MNHTIPLDNPFTFLDQDVRAAIDEDGNPWFRAQDVFDALGISWKGLSGSLRGYPEDWIRTIHVEGQRGSQEVTFISEPGIYKAAFSSRKPEAVRFTEWVCKEVLPAIRRHGFYAEAGATQQIQLYKLKINLLDKLASKDAFVHQTVMESLRRVCNHLGEPLPDPSLLGQDRQQMRLM